MLLFKLLILHQMKAARSTTCTFLLLLLRFLLTFRVIREISSRQCGNITCVIEPFGCKQDPSGRDVCDCFVGYLGDACEVDLDECTHFGDHTPCGHRGYCVNNMGSFRCDCLHGWEDNYCRTRTNAPNYVCFPGWTGHLCNDDIDECLNAASVCSGPHQYCVNTEGSYNCTCNVGWEGSACLQDINECENNPCGENQMCQNTPGSYACPCLTGWYDVNCDKNVNECVTEPCGTSGTCVDTNGSFVCGCFSGFTGEMCEINTSDLPMSTMSYAIIGSVSGFALLLLLCAITCCLYMRCKLKGLRLKQEDTRRMKMIHDRTTKVHPSAGPMFSIKRHMDDGLDNKWTASIKTTLNKHQTSNGNVLRNSPRLTTLAERTLAVKPFDGNTDYNRRPTKTYNLPNDMYQSKISRDGAQPHTMPVHYESDLSSDNKGDNNRSLMTSNLASAMVESRMTSASSLPPTIPVKYDMDPIFDSYRY